MGEGGAVFTNSSKIKRSMESIRDWEETAGVKLVVIMYVKDLNGNLIIYHMDMIINMFILL